MCVLPCAHFFHEASGVFRKNQSSVVVGLASLVLVTRVLLWGVCLNSFSDSSALDRFKCFVALSKDFCSKYYSSSVFVGIAPRVFRIGDSSTCVGFAPSRVFSWGLLHEGFALVI